MSPGYKFELVPVEIHIKFGPGLGAYPFDIKNKSRIKYEAMN